MYSKVKDFLKDDDFIHYALDVACADTFQWESYFREHPEQQMSAEEAKLVLQASPDVTVSAFTPAEKLELKERIANSIQGF